jgi:hypothetical protein
MCLYMVHSARVTTIYDCLTYYIDVTSYESTVHVYQGSCDCLTLDIDVLLYESTVHVYQGSYDCQTHDTDVPLYGPQCTCIKDRVTA